MDKIELPLLRAKDKEKCIPYTMIIGIAVLVVVLAFTCLSLGLEKEYKIHYDEKSNLDYKVYLKENNFYKEDYLGKHQLYVASLIDYIDADFDYTFKAEEKVGLEYTYYIESSLQVNDASGKKIFEETEMLLDKQKFTKAHDNKFNVDENVKINYTKYNNRAKDFVEEYGINAESKLVVKLYVGLQGKHADYDKKITEMSVMTLEIPLAYKTLQISLNFELSNSTDAVLKYKATIIENKAVFYFTIGLAVLDVIAIVAVTIYIIKNRDAATRYQKRLEKILKDYSRYITETAITERAEDLIKTKSLRIEIIKTFEGLMDIRDNLCKPILFHEERPGEEAIFYILADRVGYIYMMRVEDFK